MALVVEPTIPYSSSSLHLDDSRRWNRLLPLIRPSIKIINSKNGSYDIAIDTNILNQNESVKIAVIGSTGNLSSRILNGSNVTAFTTGKETKSISADEFLSEVFGKSNMEALILRLVQNQKFSLRKSPRVIDVTVGEQLKLDHILSLLSLSKPEARSSIESVFELLGAFTESSPATSVSKFNSKKTSTGISVISSGSVEPVAFSSASSAVENDLISILKNLPVPGENVVFSAHFADINGLSRLENNVMANGISQFFAKKKITVRVSHSTIVEDASQARGWALSVCPVPAKFLDGLVSPTNKLHDSTNNTKIASSSGNQSCKFQVSDSQARKLITNGCGAVIKAEPEITQYDTIVGDGDCGFTLRDGAKRVLNFINGADLSCLPQALSDLVDDLEVNMGGTSGALYCIFLSSLAQNSLDAETFADALSASLAHLLKYTRARVGDRTCLDCLVPFVETLISSWDAKTALEEARKGVESTKQLEAKVGRSSYLDEAATIGVPDPGAYGLLVLLEGMVMA